MKEQGKVPRVGVFLCNCGTNIGGVVDIPKVAAYTKKLSGVAYVGENLHTCSSEGITRIKEAIRNEALERVVVAACTPRTHEPLFMEAVEEAGLNRYLFQMVNIREHDSWVHGDDREAATEKAMYLVNMAVAKAIHLEPETQMEIEVTPSALVVGAGVAGMTAAMSLADQDFQVYLVEKEDEPGGLVRDLYSLEPTGVDAREYLTPLVQAVKGNGNIRLFLSSRVTHVSGFIGCFNVTIQTGGNSLSAEVGTIIAATGAQALVPDGYYGYGESDRIITQLELERRLREGSLEVPDSLAFIQCVGAMEEKGRTYCSRVCCGTALKNAIHIKDLSPSTEVSVLYRDLQAHGLALEEMYSEALRRGVKFINYTPDRAPEVNVKPDSSLTLKVYDALQGEALDLIPALIVLSTPLIPRRESKELASILRVPLSSDGFYLEAHPKMRPVDFSSDGIYMCGTAHAPKSIAESVSQGYAAASRAAIPMAKRIIKAEAVTAVLDPEKCVGCGACASVCPFNAIEWGSLGEPHITESLCKGCGLCTVECPVGAMQLRYYKDSQLSPAIRALLEPGLEMEVKDPSKPVILVVACRWCSYAAADFAGVMRLSYPVNVRIVMVPCSGKVDFRYIFDGFRSGADGVVVAGCLKDQCHYVDGNLVAERRVDAARKTLEAMGVSGGRLEMFFCSAGMPRDFAAFMREFTARVGEMGRLERVGTPSFREMGEEVVAEGG
ncbi:MAG: hydrogenase iron-sulfur subunit [Candidatus Bathyarchaeota archaeon]